MHIAAHARDEAVLITSFLLTFVSQSHSVMYIKYPTYRDCNESYFKCKYLEQLLNICSDFKQSECHRQFLLFTFVPR